MSQHDFDIANQSAPTFRSDLNAALKALASSSSGATAPASTYANMLWYDTVNNALKLRSEADDSWIIVSYFDTGAGKVRIPEGTEIYDGTDVVAALKIHPDSAWETGTDTNKRLVAPSQVKAAINANASASPIKAWASFYAASGGIQASFNIASVLRTSSRHFTVLFANPMPDAYYAVITGVGEVAADNRHIISIYHRTTTQFKIRTTFITLADTQQVEVFFSVLR